jgi:hypothetical protein
MAKITEECPYPLQGVFSSISPPAYRMDRDSVKAHAWHGFRESLTERKDFLDEVSVSPLYFTSFAPELHFPRFSYTEGSGFSLAFEHFPNRRGD